MTRQRVVRWCGLSAMVLATTLAIGAAGQDPVATAGTTANVVVPGQSAANPLRRVTVSTDPASGKPQFHLIHRDGSEVTVAAESFELSLDGMDLTVQANGPSSMDSGERRLEFSNLEFRVAEGLVTRITAAGIRGERGPAPPQ